MLPGNINERIVLFANKHAGFEGQLFSKTGEIGGSKPVLTVDKHGWARISEQRRNQGTKVKAEGGKARKRKQDVDTNGHEFIQLRSR